MPHCLLVKKKKKGQVTEKQLIQNNKRTMFPILISLPHHALYYVNERSAIVIHSHDLGNDFAYVSWSCTNHIRNTCHTKVKRVAERKL